MDGDVITYGAVASVLISVVVGISAWNFKELKKAMDKKSENDATILAKLAAFSATLETQGKVLGKLETKVGELKDEISNMKTNIAVTSSEVRNLKDSKNGVNS